MPEQNSTVVALSMRQKIARLVKRRIDLSTRQIHVLFECLDGPRAVKQLVESSELRPGVPGMDPPAVSRAVQRLSDLGYVERKEHPDDRRSVLVSLTRAGRAFIVAADKD